MAIKTETTLKVEGRVSKVDKDLWCYEDDKNIDLLITLVDDRYTIETTTSKYYNFTVIKPNGQQIDITELKPVTEGGQLNFKITGELTNKLDEIGTYKVQIHIYDSIETTTLSEVKIPDFSFDVVKRLKGNVLIGNGINAIVNDENNPIKYDGNLGVKIEDLPELNWYTGKLYAPITYNGITYRKDMSENVADAISKDFINSLP